MLVTCLCIAAACVSVICVSRSVMMWREYQMKRKINKMLIRFKDDDSW